MIPQQTLTRAAMEKLLKAIELVTASVARTDAFDPAKTYSAEELEPFDALCDRFIRFVELAIKFFKSYERFQFGEVSITTRDLLKRMEKLELISETDLWMRMRDVRNRIVHDYLPEQQKELYDLIRQEYSKEIARLNNLLSQISL